MIRLIEALNYRSLRYVRQDLGSLEILVGPNASGKTTLMEVVAFLGLLVRKGPEEAVESLAGEFRDLTWGRSGTPFELAVELEIPHELRRMGGRHRFDKVRYQVRLALDEDSGKAVIQGEGVLLKGCHEEEQLGEIRAEFPCERESRGTIIIPKGGVPRSKTRYRPVLLKGPGVLKHDGLNCRDIYYSETGMGLPMPFNLGPRKSTLGNLPEDEESFSVATWLKRLLVEGTRPILLDPRALKKPGLRGPKGYLLPDGSNLPWLIDYLQSKDPDSFNEWIEHIQTGIPDIVSIRTVSKPEDGTRFIMVRFANGMELPSWMLSEGTLRLLALTVLAYLPGEPAVYLIEEPENGIHPPGIETVFASLSSLYSGQVLVTTHSPVLLSLADPDRVLCFARTESGATDIVRGSAHPELVDWYGDPNLGVLFAGGVLG